MTVHLPDCRKYVISISFPEETISDDAAMDAVSRRVVKDLEAALRKL
jgi:hypothetical protein